MNGGNQMLSKQPIGVFDSGVGGISTLRVLTQMLPNEDFIFLGDSLHAPYGSKTAGQVVDLSQKVVDTLLAQNVKAIVIACNTATSSAKPWLVDHYPNVPIIGIEPALKEAVDDGHQDILVLGTALTLSLPKFQTQLEQYQENHHITVLPCPGLADLIEQGDKRLTDIKALLIDLFKDLQNRSFSAVVLGCTHYPFIQPLIEAYLAQKNNIKFYTGYEGIGRQLIRTLEQKNLLRENHDKRYIKFLTSKKGQDELELYKKLFKNGIQL